MKYILSCWILVSSFFMYKQHTELNKTKLAAKKANIGTFCNRYKIRGLQHYGKYPGSYPDVESVMFPKVCTYHNVLDMAMHIKYNTKHSFKLPLHPHTYDAFYTGRYNNKTNDYYDKEINKIMKELKQELEL